MKRIRATKIIILLCATDSFRKRGRAFNMTIIILLLSCRTVRFALLALASPHRFSPVCIVGCAYAFASRSAAAVVTLLKRRGGRRETTSYIWNNNSVVCVLWVCNYYYRCTHDTIQRFWLRSVPTYRLEMVTTRNAKPCSNGERILTS